MTLNIRISVFVVALLLFAFIFYLLKHGRIPLKLSLIWLIFILIIFLVALFPGFVMFFSNLLGFATISNMIIGILIVILFLLSIAFSVIISGQNTKIILLIQEVSMLKSRIQEDDVND